MPETRRRYDAEFREGAVRIVRETGKPIAQVARDWGSTGAATGWTGTVSSAARDLRRRSPLPQPSPAAILGVGRRSSTNSSAGANSRLVHIGRRLRVATLCLAPVEARSFTTMN